MMRNEVILLYRIGFKGYGSCNIYKRKRIPAFIIDETFIQIGNQKYWLWVGMEPVHRTILGMHISNEREYLSDLLSPNMENTQYTQTVEHGILTHVTFYI